MKKHNFLVYLLIVLLAGILITGCGGTTTAKYPEKPVELIISWPAGGGSDLATRALAKEAEKYLGIAFTPINMAGSNGATAWSEAVKRKPDGYSVTLLTFDVLSNQALKTSKIKYDDFEYILQFTEQPFAFMVHSDSPIKTIDDLIKTSKTTTLKMGTTPLGGVYHQAISLFELESGSQFSCVPFKGDSDEITALLGKHTDVQISTLSPVDQHVKQGTIRLLATTTEKRLPEYPDTPTLKELGYNVVYSSWRAIGVPKGTPPEIKAKLADAFKKAYESQNFQDFAKKGNLDSYYRNPEEFANYLKDLYQRVEKVLNAMKVLPGIR